MLSLFLCVSSLCHVSTLSGTGCPPATAVREPLRRGSVVPVDKLKESLPGPVLALSFILLRRYGLLVADSLLFSPLIKKKNQPSKP